MTRIDVRGMALSLADEGSKAVETSRYHRIDSDREPREFEAANLSEASIPFRIRT